MADQVTKNIIVKASVDDVYAFSNPEKQLEEDLQNFKAYVEGTHSRTAAV